MKAEIIAFTDEWCWLIYYENGIIAAKGTNCKSRSSAKRGLKRFLSSVFNNHMSLWEQADGKLI